MEGEHKLTVLCSECGEVIEVADPATLILALHLERSCEAMSKVLGVQA